jgi:acrylyl-CoA reductase (NADPH)
MPSQTFRALLAEGNSNQYATNFKDLSMDALPPGDVLIEVVYSSLNYKDGLAVTGRGKIIRKFPMVCGIDLAGRVIASSSPEFRAGDEVLAVGQSLSETVWGGFSQRARISADTAVRVPTGLDLKRAMAIGTAGFTAILSVMALEHQGILPGPKEVVVTGAGGGVGSISVALLAARGYKVAASTGRPELHEYLRQLGATTIIPRDELARKSPPLGSERWAGGIDSVGGTTLASLLATTASNGAVAACGLAGGADLNMTVFPFILRNIALLGINSSAPPRSVRVEAWERISRELPMAKIDAMTAVEPLSNIQRLSEQILDGKIRGRVVIDVNR